MKRLLPFFLFAAVTFAVFWRFLLLGGTIHAVSVIENLQGLPVQTPSLGFRGDAPHARPADNILLLAPHLRIYNEGLKHGELRLWNPTLLCGVPLYVDPMVHPFYPPHLLLHAILPPEPALELALMLHLFFSGVAMFLLLRALGRSEGAATAGGLVWMLFGYNALWFSTGILEAVMVFGPLAWLAILRGVERREIWRAPLAAVATGMTILGTHPQHALLFFLLLAAWLARAALRERRFPVRFSILYVLFTLGIGLASLLTRLETIGMGYRDAAADLDFYYAEPGALLIRMADLVLGKVLSPGHPMIAYEFALYAGMSATVLAAAAALRSFREPPVRFCLFVGALALAVAFLSPMARLLQGIPILNLGLPSRWIFLFGACLPVLSAFGWDALATGARRWALAISVATGAFVAACALSVGPFRFGNGAAVETGLGFLLAAGAAFAAGRRPRAAATLAFSALLIELLPPFVIKNWHADPAPLREIPETVRFLKDRETGPFRATGTPGRGHATEEEFVLSEYSDGNCMLAFYGVENPAGFEAIFPASTIDYALAAGGAIAPAGRALAYMNFASPLLDAAGLKYLLLPPSFKPPARFHFLREIEGVRIYENASVLPRAYVVSRVLAARDGTEAVRLLRSRDFDPRTSVILETEEAVPAGGGPLSAEVRWIERAPHRLELEVSTPSPGVLVLSETYDPGWEAEVDGLPAPVYKANVAFRGVPLTAGTHRVRFVFRPASARTGLIGSCAFLLLAFAYSAWLRKKRPS